MPEVQAATGPPGWLTLSSDLLRAVAWPAVVFFFLWYFRKEIKQVLAAVPLALGRLRSAKMPGVELTLERVELRLPQAEREAKGLQLPPGEVPQLRREKEDE